MSDLTDELRRDAESWKEAYRQTSWRHRLVRWPTWFWLQRTAEIEEEAAARIDELETALDAWTARITSHPHNWADDEDQALLRLTSRGRQLLKEPDE